MHKVRFITDGVTHRSSFSLETPDNGDYLRSFLLLLRLNVKTFFTLLQILLPELEPYASETAAGASQTASERLTATARRILPALRQYSSWLLANSRLLIAMQGDAFISVDLNEFWKIYASALTLLTATFSVVDLPAAEYLLDEDEDTIAFKPLCNEHNHLRYYESETMTLKSRSGGSIERNHPNVEMLARIRGFVTDAVMLTRGQVSDQYALILRSGHTDMFSGSRRWHDDSNQVEKRTLHSL